ncbi:DUF898 family protein [Sphingomonas sp. MAH-20]|uniref:DUF898 family protein n=1 Tax=Sphingomonas horti TaxID=2682842 RepID=A0A6I4IXX5_9SPHN|nr:MULTISPECIES: YjgN family protein [Sphingomonas]MBA2920940.1 DUF898 domain-containing protein [Sphingomonas sp. CGMCC 1.13658]MVO76926.1 DUF898 family protein [Sphingomonas horti]
MNIERQGFDAAAPDSAFRFTGNWREFAPIALTNLLLTIVTLGIYRFWARARERRYLWSRTEFIDDTLEWTGTGREMFIGFVIVMAVLLPAILFVQFGFQAMILRGLVAPAFLLMLGLYLGFFALVGLARYRALRYRLSRTYWHGIRGGGEPGGWGFAFSYLWKTLVGAFVIGLLVPWAWTSLWNERWNRMSFGPHPFEASANTEGLMGRWMLVLATPILAGLVVVATASQGGSNPETVALMGLATIFAIYAVWAIVGLGFFAAYARKAIGSLEMGGLQFAFTARSMDWLKLFLGHVGIVLATLGIGFVFISYRNWAFFIRHLEASGEVSLDTLTQSTSPVGADAEGLASAFDIGAI